MKAIITIGYGLRSPNEFLMLLQQHEIQYLVDVRTSPYSKHNAEFSQNEIKAWLAANKIIYVFLGDMLGGRPADSSCYTEGKVDYTKYSQKDIYKSGLSRLKNAFSQQLRLALMCSESKPQMCHRSKLIGPSLEQLSIPIVHIDEKGELKSQEQIITLITDKQQKLFASAFGDSTSYSRKRYQNGNATDETEADKFGDDWSVRVY
jgi:uncharacterized protein (DUF488 family)